MRASEVAYGPSDMPSRFLPFSFLDLGAFGVLVFFTLSGCTLYLSNGDRLTARGVVPFYVKRFFRIWPAFFASLVAYIGFRLAFVPLYGDPHGYWIERPHFTPFSVWDVFGYLTLSANLLPVRGALFNDAYWSLPVEFQYYICFPLLILALRYAGVAGPLVAGVVLYFVPRFVIVPAGTANFFAMAFTFCAGVAMGYVYSRRSIRLPQRVGMFLLMTFLVYTATVQSSLISFPDLPFLSSPYNFFGVMAVLVTAVVLFTPFVLPKAVERFLLWYGTISYSTYLFHNLFIATAILIVIHLGLPGGNFKLFFTLVFASVSTYFVASLSYDMIEEPAIRLGRRVADWTLNGVRSRWLQRLQKFEDA